MGKEFWSTLTRKLTENNKHTYTHWNGGTYKETLAHTGLLSAPAVIVKPQIEKLEKSKSSLNLWNLWLFLFHFTDISLSLQTKKVSIHYRVVTTFTIKVVTGLAGLERRPQTQRGGSHPGQGTHEKSTSEWTNTWNNKSTLVLFSSNQ